MRTPSKKTWISALLLCAVVAVVAERALAQNPTVKGKGKLATRVHQTGSINAGTFVPIDADNVLAVALVPEKMTLVITDIIVSNATSSAATFQFTQTLLNPGVVTHTVLVPGTSTVAYNFGTGLEFAAGSQANIFASGQQLLYTVSGYLRKGT